MSGIRNNFKGLTYFVFDDPAPIIYLSSARPNASDIQKIENESPLTSATIDGKSIDGCIETLPFDHISYISKIGQSAKIMANNTDKTIEKLSFQPHFSGLKGPKLTIMRRDLERALLDNRGSANEIYHNADIQPTTATPCDRSIKLAWDLELRHQIDAYDSDNAPLIRSDAIINNRIDFGGFFVGTLSTRIPLYDNLDDEPDLRILDRTDPIGQDIAGYAEQSIGLNRVMLSGFATPMPDLYMAGHAGLLEERFLGFGGEMLYSPFDSALSIGGEFWRTTKRTPYAGGPFSFDRNNKQTSLLLNLWYDAPDHPYSLGLSAGRFLDGDNGAQFNARYKPAQGWRIDGFATYSNEDDFSLYNDKPVNITAGLRITMPLGQFRAVPNNSRQTIEIAPFARDKGQRIDNAYALHDLTDPWQAKELYRHWDKITE